LERRKDDENTKKEVGRKSSPSAWETRKKVNSKGVEEKSLGGTRSGRWAGARVASSIEDQEWARACTGSRICMAALSDKRGTEHKMTVSGIRRPHYWEVYIAATTPTKKKKRGIPQLSWNWGHVITANERLE